MALNTIAFLVGYRCGIRCRSCLWGDQLGSRDSLDPKEACAWLDQARALADIRLVGFSGGESFLYLPTIVEVAAHAWQHGKIPSAVSTSSCWAVSPERTDRLLRELHQVGLRELLLSVDDFHQEHVPLERVKLALQTARALGIHCTLQCVVNETTHRLAYYLDALGLSHDIAKPGADEGLRATEIYCSRIGAAAKLPTADFAPKPNALSSYCSMLGPLVIAPNGDVHLCCGPAFSIPALTAGNLRREPLETIVSRAEWDPVYNALALGHGPAALAECLRASPLAGALRDDYSTSCEACVHLLSTPEVESTLRERLEEARGELFLKRTILTQESPESLAAMLRV